MKSSNQLLALKEQVVNQLQQVSLDDDEVHTCKINVYVCLCMVNVSF